MPQRSLRHHREYTAAQQLDELARFCRLSGLEPDFYGKGGAVEQLEDYAAALLNKEHAVFFPSGIMAQQALFALLHSTAGGAVGMHPLSHPAVDEEDSHLHLSRARLVPLCPPHRMLCAHDVRRAPEEVKTLSLELPQRALGSMLPTADALNDILAEAHHREMHVHIDGARLWECSPYYQQTPAQITEKASTVYLSLYKTIGAIAGALLLCPEAMGQQLRLWRRRYGGTVVHMWPLAASGIMSLRQRLPLIPEYVRYARALAAAWDTLDGVYTTPRPPHTNSFLVRCTVPAESLSRAAETVYHRNELRILPFSGAAPVESHADSPLSQFEITIGDAALDVDVDEALHSLQEIITIARKVSSV